MPRSRVKAITWETIVDRLGADDTRHIIRRKQKLTPYIFIEDKSSKKLKTLRPLRWEIIEDVEQAAKICYWCGNGSFPNSLSIELIIERANSGEELNKDEVVYDWDQVMDLVNDHLIKTMKASSAKNHRSDIRNLRNAETPFIWKKVRAWLFQKEISSRPFKNRLDSLEQLRLAISNKFGDEPEWLKRIDLVALREQHNSSSTKSKRYIPGQDLSGVRAIPTQEEAEAYLDSLSDEFQLHRWCLAMLMCYGMRNHELHHCSPLESNPKDKGFKKGIIMIPGNWRTKSKFTHWTFPVYPSWIAKYKLLSEFDLMQQSLIKRAKPKIMSAKDMSVRWDPKMRNDLGVCVNNDYLGNWITHQLRERMPDWKATVPNAKGQFTKAGQKEDVKPYDLRHSWAITVSTSSNWSHVSETDAALCMGHNIDVHRKHYQRWLSEDETRDNLLKRITAPAWYEAA